MSPFFGKSPPAAKREKRDDGDRAGVERAPDNYQSATYRYVINEDEPASPTIHNQSSSTAATTDDDPYVYSDDSASLSDAYFFPQSDEEGLARPLRYRNEDALRHNVPASFPAAAYYGSVSPDHFATSFRVAGAINEEDETSNAEATTLLQRNDFRQQRSRKDRHRTRRPRKNQDRMFRERQPAAETTENTPKDVVWAILFLLQLGVIVICSVRYGYRLWFADRSGHDWIMPWQSRSWNVTVFDSDYNTHSASDTFETAVSTRQPSFFTFDYQNCMALVGIAGLYSCILAIITYGFMLVLAKALIHITLIVSVLLALTWGLIGLTLEPYGIVSMLGFAALLLALGYTMYNWKRIPFAATNLYTSLCALRSTADFMILSLVCLSAAFAWCLLWSTAFIGIVNSMNHVECEHKEACGPHVAYQHVWIYVLLLISFHWTNMVIKNITRVVVASAVATWWFHPNDVDPFCSKAVFQPLIRSLTTSLGSICLGSLVVQPAQFVLDIGTTCSCCPTQTQNRRKSCVPAPNHQDSLRLTPSAEEGDASAMESVGLLSRMCWLYERLTSILSFCNRWAYTFIGMYGDPFLKAGQQVTQLFETRKWLERVKDALIHNVLLIACVIIGGSAGTFAVVIEETDGYDFTSFHRPIVSAFVIGCTLGFVLSSILLQGVVGSAANTILVCFVLGAYEFDQNHPVLSREMREVWRAVWEPPV